MKKIWLFTLMCSLAFAEDPVTIEIFDNSIDEIVIPATNLPDTNSPSAVILEIANVALPTESAVPPTAVVSDYKVNDINQAASVEKMVIDPVEDIAAIEMEEREVAEELKSSGIVIDLSQVFSGSPTIYTVLFMLSIASVGIWAYALLSLRSSEIMPSDKRQLLQTQLQAKNYELALETCKSHPTLLFGMVASAIINRQQGSAAMLELMKAEGRRLSISYWQKINLLNDIAIIAPMLGLLGTVLGMFYAFYDLNRSAESISALFDGLGISVGTTVGGLVVAILALMFHAITKYRLTKQLIYVEAEAESLAKTIKGDQ